MKLGWQPRKWLEKKAKQGVRAYPLGTVAFYGPDESRATKVAVSVIHTSGSEPAEPMRWFSETGDVREDDGILAEIAIFLRQNDVRSIAMPRKLLGCPHEEGVDYPGETCPRCPYWAGRDRLAGILDKK